MDRTAEELIADAEFCEKQAAAQEADGNTEQAQCSRDFAKECRDKAGVSASAPVEPDDPVKRSFFGN